MTRTGILLMACLLVISGCNKNLNRIVSEREDPSADVKTDESGSSLALTSFYGLWQFSQFYVGHATVSGGFELDAEGITLDNPGYPPLFFRFFFDIEKDKVTRYGIGVVFHQDAIGAYSIESRYYFKTDIRRDDAKEYYLTVNSEDGSVTTNIPTVEHAYTVQFSDDGKSFVLAYPTGTKNSLGEDLFTVAEFIAQDRESALYLQESVCRDDVDFLNVRKAYLDEEFSVCVSGEEWSLSEEQGAWLRTQWEGDFDKEF